MKVFRVALSGGVRLLVLVGVITASETSKLSRHILRLLFRPHVLVSAPVHALSYFESRGGVVFLEFFLFGLLDLLISVLAGVVGAWQIGDVG